MAIYRTLYYTDVSVGVGGRVTIPQDMRETLGIDEGDSLNGRPVRSGVTGVPVFEDAIAWMECEVRHTHDLGSHTLFIGELVAAAIVDDEKRPAAMSDTRMKYGGVKRH